MICLICKKDFSWVCRHAQQAHKISAREYKEMFGLDVSKGLLSDEDREVMRRHAIENDMPARLMKLGAKTRFGNGHNFNYKRSDQTLERLRTKPISEKFRKGRPQTVAKIIINCALCGKEKEIYPRYLKEGNNYCGVVCRNRRNNSK